MVQLLAEPGEFCAQHVFGGWGIEDAVTDCFEGCNQAMHCTLWSLESVTELCDAYSTWTVSQGVENSQGLDERLDRLMIFAETLCSHVKSPYPRSTR